MPPSGIRERAEQCAERHHRAAREPPAPCARQPRISASAIPASATSRFENSMIACSFPGSENGAVPQRASGRSRA